MLSVAEQRNEVTTLRKMPDKALFSARVTSIIDIHQQTVENDSSAKRLYWPVIQSPPRRLEI
jgi:hypothetical protein